MSKPAIGSRVIIKPECDAELEYTGVVFEVVDHQRVNIDIKALGEGAKRLGRKAKLRLNPDLVTAAPDGYDDHTTATATLVPYYEPIPLGAVFTVKAGALRGVSESTLLVVLDVNRQVYKAARLGGDDNRYFPKVARAAMTVVPFDQIAAHLAAAGK